MSTFIRPTLRTAAFTVAGAGIAYQGCRYYYDASSFLREAHAESMPSDAKAALKKMEWKGFTELKLESAEMYNHNVKKLTFALPDDQTVTGISPISTHHKSQSEGDLADECLASLLTQHTPEGAWIPVFRPYTPVSPNGSLKSPCFGLNFANLDPDQPGKVTFMVKRYPGGKGSGKMHSLVPGDTMKFKPLHELDYKPNEYSHMTFIAGGSGITPIYQLAHAILLNPADSTKICLIYANNKPADILLREEFDDLERKYPKRFQKLFIVSKDGDQEGLPQGYVTKDMIQTATLGKSDKVLVSGPPAMIEAVAGSKGGFGWTQGSIGGILKELGYTKEQVHKF